MNEQTEKWAVVEGYEGLYEVSDLGRVRRLPSTVVDSLGRVSRLKGRLLRQMLCTGGYPTVALCKRGTSKKVRVHRLVAIAFVTGRAPGLEVCHNDGIRTNCAATNLRWDTRANNCADAVRHGSASHLSKYACPKGHEYTPENTLLNAKGARVCRVCKRDEQRRRRRRQRAGK